MARERLTIGTRGSQLALKQTELVAGLLQAAHPGLQIELEIIQTKGDVILDRALSRIGDKGLFVTEIERALLDGRIDLAVHSCKDLPSETPEGLTLAAFPARADARDALISRHDLSLDHLPRGARIGTSSLRRACQLRAYRPDFDVVDLRGNVDTRLRRAMTADYDAVILAAAGLQRLALDPAITELLDPAVMLPAVAQGALALECRADDREVVDLVAALDDRPTRLAVQAERAFLARLQGGCQVPLAAYAMVTWHEAADGAWAIHVRGLVGTADGVQVIRGERRGAGTEAYAIGAGLAEDLLRQGGDRILDRLRQAVPAVEAPEAV
jgi:hydroxymethylbilane synthase